jgi:mono/diheme cytochrome c family protein
MKNKLKRVGKIAGGVLLVAIVGVLGRFYGLLPRSRPAPQLAAATSPEVIKRGEYIANHLSMCVTCHSAGSEAEAGQPRAANAVLGAGRVLSKYKEYPTKTGGACSPNITPSKEHGIGNWSDGEVTRAFREGVGRDGRGLWHLMPYPSFRHMSDDDALAVVAYLRTLKPDETTMPRPELKFPVSMLIRSVPEPLPAAVPPPANDPVSRGNYLLYVGICHQCHDSMNKMHQPIEGQELSGGFPMHFPRGTVYPANITSDKATGIGAYTDEEIIRAITKGVTKSGRPIYLMPWRDYEGMTEDDLKAIVAALRASKPVTKAVPPPELHDVPEDARAEN